MGTNSRIKRHCLAVIGAIAVWSATGPVWSADSPLTLERQLKSSASQVLKKLHERDIARVGVLKFRVQLPGTRASDSVGTLNMFLAERLEAALALANPTELADRIQLVRQASLTAAAIPGASHLSEAGRQKLFSQAYPSAWGTKSVYVEAFLTGMAQFAPDLKSFTLAIQAVHPGKPDLEPLVRSMKVVTDGRILNEISASFQIRGIPDDSVVADPADAAQLVRQAPEQYFPLTNNPTVTLRIFYDGIPVDLTFRDGQAWIPEPREGQKVTMALQRMDENDFALGCVLKVNGESTLYRERMQDVDCQKWILTRERPRGTIRGFQCADSDELDEFRVASGPESKDQEMYYGADVGTISLTVFQQRLETAVNDTADTTELTGDAAAVIAIQKARFPIEPPADAEALKMLLLSAAGEHSTRGVIAPGPKASSKLEYADHEWDPEPIISAVIHYY